MYDDTLFASPMKTLLLALLLVTGSAEAEWVQVGEGASHYKYIDPETIRRDGNFRKVWEINDYKQRQKTGNLSNQMRSEYDCKQERYRFLSFSLHSGPMLGGTTLYWADYTRPPDDWREIPPGSLSDIVLKIVCAQ